MKRFLLIGVCLVFCASMASAQSGTIAVFSDANGTGCNWTDIAPALQPVYIFHVFSAGATVSQWKLDAPATWSHLGDNSPFALVIGTSIDDCSVSYGTCMTGSFLLMTVNFFGSGLEAPCTYFGIVAAPFKEGIQVIDCADGRAFPAGGQGIVNPDGTCQCDVPVEDTTWGGIKALYN